MMNYDSEEQQIIAKMDDKAINILCMDMRDFSLPTYFYMMNGNNVSLKRNSIAKQLLKKALNNYFGKMKLFKAMHKRKFVLNAIFIYELVKANVFVSDITLVMENFLKRMGHTRLSVFEAQLVRETYFTVLTSLENGTVEANYSHWLTTLYNGEEDSHGLLIIKTTFEQQMFAVTNNLEMSEEMREYADSLLDACAQIPDYEERHEWKQLADNKLPSREEWNNFSELAKKMSARMPKLDSAFDNLTRIQKNFERLEENTQQSIAGCKNFFSIAKDVLACSTVAWALYNANQNPGSANKIILAGAVVLAFTTVETNEARTFLVASGLLGTCQMLYDLLSKSETELETQMLSIGDTVSVFKAFTEFMTSVKWSQLPRKILDTIRVCKELPSFIMQVFNLIKGFLNEIWVYFFKVPLFMGNHELRKNYTELLNDLYSKFHSNNLEHTFDEAQLVTQLIDETRLYLNECKEFGDRKILDSHLRVLLDIQKELSDIRYSQGGARQEPTILLLEGPPGTKKTVWSRLFAATLVRILRKDIKDTDSEIYVKPSGDYWSQYKNQLITCFDDFGQVRDSLGDPREKGDLINMYNSAPFPLNMNENEDKGKTYFTSQFVIMTANESWHESPSILSKGALTRRIDLRITVKCKEKDAQINDTGIQSIVPDNYSFFISDGWGKNPRETDFQGVIDHLMRGYRIKDAHYKCFKSIQKNIIEKVDFSKGAKEDIDRKVAEVEEKISQLCGTSADVLERQSHNKINQDSKTDEDDLNMIDISQDIQPNERLIEEKIPKLNVYLPQVTDGTKELNGYKFKCQYFEDLDELSYQSARNLIDGYTDELFGHSLKNFDEPIDKPTRDFLELHYGSKRTDLFLREYKCAKTLFGSELQRALKAYAKSISKESRGYFFTDLTVLMSVWSSNRIDFFRSFFNPEILRDNLIPMKCFNEAVVLTDYSLALVRCKHKFMSVIQGPMDILSSIVAKVQFRVKETMVRVLGWYVQITPEQWNMFYMAVSGIVGTATIVIPLATLAAKWFGKGETSEQSSQLFYKPADNKQTKNTLKSMIKSAALTKQSVNLIPVVQRIEQSSATLTLIEGDVRQTLGKVFFIDSYHILLPLHYYSDIVEHLEATYIIDDGDVKVNFSAADLVCNASVVETEHLELAVVRKLDLKKTRRNCVDNFMTREQVSKLTDRFQVGLHPYTDNNVLVTGVAYIDKLRVANNKPMCKMVKYNIDTGKGDCGSLVYVMSASLGKTIICGMHEAGTKKGSYDKTGAAFIVTREDIIDALAYFDQEQDLEEQGCSASTLHSHSPYGKSRIVPSPIAGHPSIRPKKFPAKLMPSKDGSKDPFAIGLAKYKQYSTKVDWNVLDEAKRELISEMCSFEHIVRYGSKVPYDKAFYGDENVLYQKAIPTSTSSGYPFKFQDRYIKQRLKEEGPEGPSFDSFVKDLQKLEERMERGERQLFVHTSNLKDETRPREKVESYSTRVFFGTPLDLCVLTKRYFGEFVLFMMEDCIEKGTAMSVNPHSVDWKRIAQRLSRLAPSYELAICQDFDYSHFDGSNNPIVLNVILEVINSWYNHVGCGQDNHIREILFREISNFKYIYFTEIREMVTSLPSGSFLTLLVNCLTNKLLVRYAYFKRYPGGEFSRYVSDIVLGDDNVIAVSVDIAYEFSPVMVADGVADLGFEMTFGDKSQVKARWSTLEEVTFLKRKFRLYPNRIIRAPLDMDTLWNTMCWSKKGNLREQILKDNIEFFYREASQHGRDVFEVETKKLRKILQEYPEYNVHPYGKGYDWSKWDRIVRCTPFFANHEL